MKTLDKFQGLDNKSAPERLATLEKNRTRLSEAVNVDVTDAAGLKRRQGFSRVYEGNCHSLCPIEGTPLFIDSGRLKLLRDDFTAQDLLAVGDAPMAYAQVNSEIFFSNGQMIGAYDGAAEVLAKAGTYERTAQYLDQSEDADYYDSPPPGFVLCAYAGRLFVADAETIWYSRPFFPRRFDLTKDFTPFPGVTMLQPVLDGLYVGTSKEVWFFAGWPFAPRKVSSHGAIKGASLVCEADRLELEGVSGEVAVWESTDGCKRLGTQGGQVLNLTGKYLSTPSGVSGTSILREQNGQSHILSLIQDRGEGSNMRASDVAVAEVRRNGIII